jgi:uncharacterized protein YndB with AHSA1/START domain
VQGLLTGRRGRAGPWYGHAFGRLDDALEAGRVWIGCGRLVMRVEKSVVIARPVEDVWAGLSNSDNVKRWSVSGSEFKQTSPGPMGVGASLEEGRMVLGRFVRYQSFIVTEYEPNRTLAMNATLFGIIRKPGTLRFTLGPTGEGTRVTYVAEMDLKRGLRPFEGRFAKLLSQGTGRQLANLKRLAEAGVFK